MSDPPSTGSLPSAADLRRIVERRLHFTGTELELQNELDWILVGLEIPMKREVCLTAKDRVDFLVGRVAVELKVDSARNAVLRQLLRYAQSERVDEILLVTTRYSHCNMPHEVSGKPIVVALIGSALA
jgi:hypothetical protein